MSRLLISFIVAAVILAAGTLIFYNPARIPPPINNPTPSSSPTSPLTVLLIPPVTSINLPPISPTPADDSFRAPSMTPPTSMPPLQEQPPSTIFNNIPPSPLPSVRPRPTPSPLTVTPPTQELTDEEMSILLRELSQIDLDTPLEESGPGNCKTLRACGMYCEKHVTECQNFTDTLR